MGDRAVSDVVSYVLIFSMVAVTIGVVSVAGFSTLQDVRNVEQVSNTERAFEVLADNLKDIHREGAPTRATEISLANGGVSTTSTATINVTGWGSSTAFSTGQVTSDVVRWRASRGGTEQLAYEFGSVLRSSRSGGLVTRRGPFEFDDDRTIIPIVQTRATNPAQFSEGVIRVRGERSLSSVVHRGEPTNIDNLWINVTTAHGLAWQNYLADQPGTTCTLTDAGDVDRLDCRLTVPDELYVTIHPVNVALER